MGMRALVAWRPRSLGLERWAIVLLLGLLGWTQATARSGAAFVSADDFGFAATHLATGRPFESAPLFGSVTLAPGVMASEAVLVRNTGTVPLAVRLRAALDGEAQQGADSPAGAGAFLVEVRRGDGTAVFRGPLAQLDARVLERLDAQQEEIVHLAVSLRAEAAASAARATVSFTLQAEQAL